MAEQLKAELAAPADVTEDMLSKYELIGFGSGIYNRKHHQSLFDMLKRLPDQAEKKAFIFSTNSCGPGYFSEQLHKPLRDALKQKGFRVLGEYCCKGFMDHSFIKWFDGGINKEHPDKNDLERAKAFVENLRPHFLIR